MSRDGRQSTMSPRGGGTHSGMMGQRAVWTIIAAAPVLVLWVVLALMSRDILPGSIALTDRLFMLAVPITYLGAWAVLILAARDPRTMLFRGITATLCTVLVLLALELPARLGWVHWAVVFRRLNGEAADYGTAYVYDADLAFRRIPGLRWSTLPLSDIEQSYGLPRTASERITFTYDRWGYRNPTDQSRAEIVLLGDSYVEGWYVSDEQTVAARLAEQLGTTVANLGVAGYGTLQELRVLRGDGLARHPRTVVWFFFEGNDLYDDQHFENTLMAGPPRPEETVPHPDGLAAGHGWRERSFMRSGVRWLRRWSEPLVPNRAPYGALPRGGSATDARIYFADYAAVPWTQYEVDRWETAAAAMQEGIGIARGRGVDVVLVYIPIKYRVYQGVIDVPPGSPMARWKAWRELPERFRALCATANVPCLDLTAPFEHAARDGVSVYARTDTHWSAEGHALAAATLARVLSRR